MDHTLWHLLKLHNERNQRFKAGVLQSDGVNEFSLEVKTKK
jgi:hypothetical protein